MRQAKAKEIKYYESRTFKRVGVMSENITRVTLEQARKLKSLSNARKFNEMTEEELDKQIAEDPGLYQLTNEELAQFEVARSNKK